MKKLSALIMFTLLSTVGYYIGNAVAQNKNAQGTQADGNGILVVEEEYDVVVPATAGNAAQPALQNNAQSVSRNATQPAARVSATSANRNVGAQNNMSGKRNNGAMVDETVTEEGYVTE